MCQNLCNEHELERALPKASRGVQSTAKHESVVVVEDNGLSIFGLESSEMKHMIHMMTMMGMMDGMTRMTPECPIICSSNHIDDASGLVCPHAKGICLP